MAIDYALQPFGPEIAAAYGWLFSDALAETTPAFLGWHFDRCHHVPGLFAVARSEGRIIGMIALVATRMRIGSTLQPAYQAVQKSYCQAQAAI